jgi:D-serine deaminase-like pyridoxal phosphate-dependent protein
METLRLDTIRTPALLIDLDLVDQNLAATLKLLGNDPSRWRPHLKTVKLGLVMRRIVARGITQAKVSTTLELETACASGFTDVLLAYPIAGPGIDLVRDIGQEHPTTRISVLVESAEQVALWEGSRIGIFIDLNSGMNRTGMLLDAPDAVIGLARTIKQAGLRFAGLHFYDGQAAGFPADRAALLVHQGYDRLNALVGALKDSGIATPEVITAGTPAFPHAVSYRGFPPETRHRVSPGTVVYNDRTSLTQLPGDAGYRTAVQVLSRTISHPRPGRFCADAGHKAISADAGDPVCEVIGHPEYVARHPSEEHLPFDVAAGAPLPPRGTLLSLLPTHVCPTVNNFDYAVIVQGGKVVGMERVTARGRHPPLGGSAAGRLGGSAGDP